MYLVTMKTCEPCQEIKALIKEKNWDVELRAIEDATRDDKKEYGQLGLKKVPALYTPMGVLIQNPEEIKDFLEGYFNA